MRFDAKVSNSNIPSGYTYSQRYRCSNEKIAWELNNKSIFRIFKTGTLPVKYQVPGYSIERSVLILDPICFLQNLFFIFL